MLTSYAAWIGCTLTLIALGFGYAIYTGWAAREAVRALADGLGARQVATDPPLWEAMVSGRTVRVGHRRLPAHDSASPGWQTASAAAMVGAAAMGAKVDLAAVAGETVTQLVIEVACRNPALVDLCKLGGALVREGNMAQLDARGIDQVFALPVRRHELVETLVDGVRYRMDQGFLRLVREPGLRAWLERCVALAESVERAAPLRSRRA